MTLKELLFETYLIALPILLSYIVYMLKENKKARDANAEGTKMLIKIKLIEYHDRYCRIGSIPSYVYENFSKLYKAYKGLGGNDIGQHLMEDIDKLEIRKVGFYYEEQTEHDCKD